MLTDNVIPFTIPNNGNLSEARDITPYQLNSLEMSSAWTAANLIVLAANTYTGTYLPVYDDGGIKASIVTAASRMVSLSSNALALAPLKFIKLQSVSTSDNTTAVNQVGVAGARTYPITTNAVAGDTVTINGVTFTAVEADAGDDEFIPGVDATATGTVLKTALNANAIISALFTATDALGTVSCRRA